jgi:aspartyl/glutamyl-tRNA(Asn/Gln) amidotransferase C subunit
MATLDDVKRLAALARVSVSPSEEARLTEDFSNILAFVETIQKVPVDSDISTPEHRNVFRNDDTPHEGGVHTEALLKNARATKDGYVLVKKVIEHGR